MNQKTLAFILGKIAYIQAEQRYMHIKMNVYFNSIMQGKYLDEEKDIADKMIKDNERINDMVQPFYQSVLDEILKEMENDNPLNE